MRPRRGAGLKRLVALIAFLRSPKGCPWDRKQTHLSLIRYLKSEARELERALRRGRWHEIEDELGDILLQVLLHSQIAAEKGLFDLEDVARSQYVKLRRRHPHVFGRRARFKSAREVKLNWRGIKARERLLRERDVRTRKRP